MVLKENNRFLLYQSCIRHQAKMSKKDLENFFSNLNDRSITVCENCSEKGVLARKRRSDLGYCFYRVHEGIYANETGILYLSWGAYSADELVMLTVVNAILDEAKACKLEANWDGAITDRIVLTNLDKSYFK